jgi:hypothetical protein
VQAQGMGIKSPVLCLTDEYFFNLVLLKYNHIARIDYLVEEARQFKSRDDFIELACHDFLVRRNPAGELLG